MKRVRVTFPLTLPSGTVLYLSAEQADSRRSHLEPLPQSGWFRATHELCFKAGEVLGFDALPRRYLHYLEVVDKTEPPSTQQVDGPKLLTIPQDLSFLEQIAWQLAASEGTLTIAAYHKRCRNVGRRRLQKVLKGLVEKGLLMREGQSHHRCYHLGEKPCK